MKILYLGLVLLLGACSHPKASVVAYMDPTIESPLPKTASMVLVFSSSSVRAKKFAFVLQEALQTSFTMTQKPEQSEFHLVLQMSETTTQETTYQTRSNPNFMMANNHGQIISVIHPAYVQIPISEEVTYQSIGLDLYQDQNGELQKIWESTVLIAPKDFSNNMQSLANALVPLIGQDVQKNIRLE